MSRFNPESVPSQFESKEAEDKWSKIWEDAGTYRFSEKSDAARYVIDTPPPTVSGSLHVGHVFSYTQTETGEETFVGVPEQGGRDLISTDPLSPGTVWGKAVTAVSKYPLWLSPCPTHSSVLNAQWNSARAAPRKNMSGSLLSLAAGPAPRTGRP